MVHQQQQKSRFLKKIVWLNLANNKAIIWKVVLESWISTQRQQTSDEKSFIFKSNYKKRKKIRNPEMNYQVYWKTIKFLNFFCEVTEKRIQFQERSIKHSSNFYQFQRQWNLKGHFLNYFTLVISIFNLNEFPGDREMDLLQT
jgi:hypothetical protein